MPEKNHELIIGLSHSVKSRFPEVKYVFNTLCQIAGYSPRFVELSSGHSPDFLDVYYGPSEFGDESVIADLQIDATKLDFTSAREWKIAALWEEKVGMDTLPLLSFHPPGSSGCRKLPNGAIRVATDFIAACYWLLSGVAEPDYLRDERDNLDLEGSGYLEFGLNMRPIVSESAIWLQKFFRSKDKMPYSNGLGMTGRPAFCFTHDVDYPEILRLIEPFRFLREHGTHVVTEAVKLLLNKNAFWKFRDWMEWENEHGAKPTFYFMARSGSLLQYAGGIPDAFYRINRKPFLKLFRELKESGCEIGLHASYLAYRDTNQFLKEKRFLEYCAGTEVLGNRNHYWHLNPDAPWDTLYKMEKAGLQYDSSLGFEFYPGFRRGICHPFYPWHPVQRKALNVVEIPPTWMDDHFDRRLVKNGITNPQSIAAGLLNKIIELNGVAVVDYHVRGMNDKVYPQYGKWLMDFMRDFDTSQFDFATPAGVLESWRGKEL